jgi:hypothetical protein
MIVSDREEIPTLEASLTTGAGSELDHRVQRPLRYPTNMLQVPLMAVLRIMVS